MDSCADLNKLEFCQKLMDRVNMPGYFPAHIHCRITHLTPEGRSVGELDVAPENLNGLGIVHGGALAALADTVAGSGVLAATAHTCVTVSYGMNFLRPASGSTITCTAAPEHLGRRICVMHADLFDDKGTKVATGEFTFCVMGPLDPENPFGRRKNHEE